MRRALPLFALLSACTGNTTNYPGLKMSDYFKFDGDRVATYTNEDTSITWQLEVAKKAQTSIVDGREIVTFDYSRTDTFELLGSVSWSMVSGDEVLVHAYSIGAEAALDFDPAVAITDDSDAERTGDSVTTETTDSGGTAWTFVSTYVEMVPECGTIFLPQATQCAHMTIDDGDSLPTEGPLFSGDFVLVADWGPAYMTIPTAGAAGEWELVRYDYESTSD
jgi:hypothetical protein